MTIGDAIRVVARLAGVPAPLILLHSRWLKPLVPVVAWLERFVPLPSLLGSETLQTMGTTWWVSTSKAEEELGYTHRALEEGMAETVIWEAAKLRSRPSILQPKPLLAGAAVALAALLLLREKGSE
jgi:nucleoside-diphosphate-sugar epimerase